MPKRSRLHLGLYGNAKIPRAYCKQCRQWAFIIGGLWQCCLEPITDSPDCTKRMSRASGIRGKPPLHLRKSFLERHNHACAYCFRMFGAIMVHQGRMIKLRLHWDHAEPFAYNWGNPPDNWLPACHLCNFWKSDLIFNSLEEIHAYVTKQFHKKGYQALSDLPDIVPPSTQDKAIL